MTSKNTQLQLHGSSVLKYILILPNILYPYCILFIVFCLKSGYFMSSMFNNNAYTCILFIALWWVVSLACTLLTCVLFNNLSKVDLIMKLSQIPGIYSSAAYNFRLLIYDFHFFNFIFVNDFIVFISFFKRNTGHIFSKKAI